MRFTGNHLAWGTPHPNPPPQGGRESGKRSSPRWGWAASAMLRRFVLTFSLLTLITGTASAEPVDLALILAVDVSGSVNEAEYQLQRQGYASAFTDPRVLNAIHSGPRKKIAVAFVEWSGLNSQKLTVDWTVISDEESAAVFANGILAAKRPFGDRTSISGGIDFAMRQFEQSGVTTERRTIDVSGDGTNNSGRPVQAARDEAVRAGITINGLAIVNSRNDAGAVIDAPEISERAAARMDAYFKRAVIGGPGAFVMTVVGFDTFGFAIANKLVREIASAPALRGIQTAQAIDS
jgi:hypothetical protein